MMSTIGGPQTLVAPTTLLASDSWRAWHGGLLKAFGYLHVTIYANPEPDPGMGRRPAPAIDPHAFHQNLSVTITSEDDKSVTNVYYGSGSGSNPMVAHKITENTFDVGSYILTIMQPDIEMNYRETFVL